MDWQNCGELFNRVRLRPTNEALDLTITVQGIHHLQLTPFIDVQQHFAIPTVEFVQEIRFVRTHRVEGTDSGAHSNRREIRQALDQELDNCVPLARIKAERWSENGFLRGKTHE